MHYLMLFAVFVSTRLLQSGVDVDVRARWSHTESNQPDCVRNL